MSICSIILQSICLHNLDTQESDQIDLSHLLSVSLKSYLTIVTNQDGHSYKVNNLPLESFLHQDVSTHFVIYYRSMIVDLSNNPAVGDL